MSALAQLEQFEFHQTLETTDGDALVVFSSNECASCKFWEELLQEYQENHPGLSIFRIDTGKDQALAEEFDVFHLPALHLYHGGQYHSEVQCEAKVESIESAIKQALAAPAQDSP